MSKNKTTTQNKNQKENKDGSKGSKALNVAKDVVKGAGAAVSVAKGVIDLISLVKQHPEWYTHYDTSHLIALNLSNKQGIAYAPTKMSGSTSYTTGFKMPAVAQMQVQLTVPKNDLEGWRTGVRLLWQQLRTANDGRINFTVYDLEKYIVNVGLLHAIYGDLTRMYRLTYTFRSTNAYFPADLLMAAGVDPDSFLANAADLFMYIQRFEQRLRVSFPLDIDFFRRRNWLFSNVFADSNSKKPSFYVTTLARLAKIGNSGSGCAQIYYVSSSTDLEAPWTKKYYNNNTSNTNKLRTYQEYISDIEIVIRDLIDSQKMANIAADIIKAFHDKAFPNWLTHPAIDDGMVAVFDEDILAQLQNSNVVGSFATNTGNELNMFMSPAQVFAQHWTTYSENDQTTGSEWIESNLRNYWSAQESNITPFDQKTALDILAKNKDYLLNWRDDKIDPGHIMSITRLTPLANEVVFTNNYISFFAYNTEVVVSVNAVVHPVSTATTAAAYFVPFAGKMLLPASVKSGEAISVIMAMWANFDYAPRFQVLITQTSSGETHIIESNPQVLDWDVFAISELTNIQTFNSYGNQSILYAGASTSQNKVDVYLKATGKNITRGRKYDKPEFTKSDKE